MTKSGPKKAAEQSGASERETVAQEGRPLKPESLDHRGEKKREPKRVLRVRERERAEKREMALKESSPGRADKTMLCKKLNNCEKFHSARTFCSRLYYYI